MKSIHTIILSILIANFVAAQEKVNLKFNFYFANSNEGSIRKTKLVVKSDGVKIGESTVKDQDKYNSVEVNIPKGYHRITAVACAQNDDVWEERTLANDYSMDCIYEKSQNWNTGYIIDLRFDLKDMDVKVDEEIIFSDEVLDNITSKTKDGTIASNSGINYKTALQKVNDYLKTFDNGYYGYLEVKDGYLYDRFKNGTDYCKAKITDLDYAFEKEKSRKVDIACKSSYNCLYSTFTNQNYSSFSFSQSTDFNSNEFITLLNNFITAYNKNPVSNSKSKVDDALVQLKSNNSSLPNTSTKNNYQTELKKLNDYLKNFDDGYYGYFEVIDNDIYIRLKAGTYCKADVNELDKAYITEENKKIELKCLDANKCMTATYTNGKINGLPMYQSSSYNTTEFAQLINNLLDAVRGKKPSVNTSVKANTTYTPSNNSTANYQTALEKLNTFLKPMDKELSKWIEIKNGYIIEHFRGTYTSKAKISDIEGVEKDTRYNVVHLYCKNKSKCVYSDYMKSDYDYFNYNCSSTSEMNTLYSLMTNFWNQLTGKKSSTTENDDDWIDEDFDELAKVAPKINTTTKITTANYQTELKKLNDYLKTFDNGYYGYFEVKDGYIYDRFKAGKYNKFKMEDMEGAVIQEQYSRVIFKCKYDDKCISTDWKENGREEYTQFTKSGSYNYQELADLLNNFRDAYLGNKSTNSTANSSQKYTESSEFLDGLKSNIDIMNSGNSTNQPKNKTSDSRDEIAKNRQTNKSTATNNNDEWIDEEFELTDSQKSSFSNLTDKKNNIPKGTKVLITGFWEKEDNLANKKKYIGQIGTAEYDIIESNIGTYSCGIRFDGEEKPVTFYGVKFKVVNNSSNNQSPTSTSNYTEKLKKLNEYLKTFNSETYREVEVKDGKVYFAFYVYGANYKSSIDISELKNNTIITIGKSVGSSVIDEVKISCKSGSKCFYSTYSNGNADHFRFFSNSIKDFTKMEQLLKDFIKSLVP